MIFHCFRDSNSIMHYFTVYDISNFADDFCLTADHFLSHCYQVLRSCYFVLCLFSCGVDYLLCSQGPEEMCLSLEHQNPSKTSKKMGYFDRVERLQFRNTFYRPQTKRPRARKIGLQYKILGTSCLGRPSVTLRATCRAPARIWLAVIDFQKSISVR